MDIPVLFLVCIESKKKKNPKQTYKKINQKTPSKTTDYEKKGGGWYHANAFNVI